VNCVTLLSRYIMASDSACVTMHILTLMQVSVPVLTVRFEHLDGAAILFSYTFSVTFSGTEMVPVSTEPSKHGKSFKIKYEFVKLSKYSALCKGCVYCVDCYCYFDYSGPCKTIP